MRTFPLALALLAVGFATAGAAPARAPLQLGHLLGLASFSELTWSGDGRHLAFVADVPDTAADTSNQDLWLWNVGEAEPFRLTSHAASDFSPTFSPSGDTIAFIGTRGTGDEARPSIWMLSLHGGEPWSFGRFDESVSEVRWSPNGRWLAYVQLDTLPKRVREWRRLKRDASVQDERFQVPQLWLADLTTGTRRRLLADGRHLWYVRWSPDSRRLACLAQPTGRADDANEADIAVVDVPGGTTHDVGGIGAAFSWSPDGRWIAWAAGAHRQTYVEKSDLWVAPAAGGKPVSLTAGFDEDAYEPAWNPGSDTLFFHASWRVTSRLAAVARTGGGVRLGLDRRADAGALALARGGRSAWVQSRPEMPSEIWVAERPGEIGRPLTGFHAAFRELALGSTRAVTWTSDDGTRIEGLLIRPPNAPSRGALRTLVMLHGGPYADRNSLGFQTTAQWFATHGYQVFLPNFRSSGGYGTAFMVRKRADWGFQDWRDVVTGLDSLVAADVADPRRLGLFGRSYGGYLTAWGITQTARFDAACVFAGAVDLAAHFGQSDVWRYRAFEFEGFPWETPENWRRSSPITYVARVKTPTLIQVGENDARVPAAQSLQLYRALTALKVPTQLVRYPREGHVLREPRHRADLFERMLAWWDRWVK